MSRLTTEQTRLRFEDLIRAGVLEIGDGYRAKRSELTGDGPIFLRAVHLQNRGFDFNGVDRFAASLAAKVASKMSKAGDTVITTKGNSTGRTGFVTSKIPEFVYSPHLSFWRSLKPELLVPRFLRYWALGSEFQHQLEGLKASTDMAPYLSLRDQRRLVITLPAPHNQRAIAEILGALDDKIELNCEMNLTLQALAHGLFKSWFLDFEPVVTKAAGQEPVGVDAETATLFADRFVDSQLGPIPEGWRWGRIADLAEYVNGRNFTKDASGTGRVVVRIADLTSGPGPSTIYNDVEADPSNLARPGDLLFAWSGSLGVYRWYGPEALINQHIFKVIVCDAYPNWFVFHHLQEAMPFFQQIASGKATTMGHIKRSHLREVMVPLPPESLRRAASRLIKPATDRLAASHSESATLAQLRNTLLPELLSGSTRLSKHLVHVGL